MYTPLFFFQNVLIRTWSLPTNSVNKYLALTTFSLGFIFASVMLPWFLAEYVFLKMLWVDTKMVGMFIFLQVTESICLLIHLV